MGHVSIPKPITVVRVGSVEPSDGLNLVYRSPLLPQKPEYWANPF